jgi:hypothetical protein
MAPRASVETSRLVVVRDMETGETDREKVAVVHQRMKVLGEVLASYKVSPMIRSIAKVAKYEEM